MTVRDAFDTLNDPARRNEGRFFGKYRGLVKDNKDPLKLGRIQATVPAIPGMATNWALPCAPYAGKQVGFYTIPPIGAKVWIEFEGGDPTYPIWTGCFWQDQEVPTEVGTNADDPSQVKVFKTRVVSVFVDDTDQKGQVNLKFNDPTIQECPTITAVLNSTGLVITVTGSKGTSKITMTPELIQTDSVALTANTSKDTTVNAQGNIAAAAQKDVTITASGKVTATATGDAALNGNNCTVQASTGSLTLSGQAGATLMSTLSTKVSGSTSLTLGGASISFSPA